MEKEENLNEQAEGEASAQGAQTALGKFKSVDALAHAYEQLEAEFTRRSQRLKALEESQAANCSQEEEPPSHAEQSAEELYRAVQENEGVRAKIIGEYLSSLKGVPLMAGGGASVTAPKARIKSFAEAGELALGYFRNQKKS